MRIAMIGSGYVGLVSGACLADVGHDVVCVDFDEAKIEALQAGVVPIFEPGLDILVVRNAEAGRLSFTTDLSSAVASADVVFIAVGTPSQQGDGHADLSYVHSAAASIAEAAKGFTVVVLKSTVPVGTGDEVERIIRQVNPRAEIAVASNPEFLREGAAINDFKRPDRIVIGVEDDWARTVLAQVYRPLRRDRLQVQFTSRRSAEIIKYASNAFLAMKIAFINEIADFCETTGADVQEVARGIGMDARIGPKFLHAGPGYGGSCFPKDTLAFVRMGQDFGSPLRLVETTLAVNEQRKRNMASRVVAACGGSVRGRRIAILGLTFKPNTDDMRAAPALAIIPALLDGGAIVNAYDPQGMHEASLLLPSIDYAESALAAAEGADCVVVVTEWAEFRSLDLRSLKAAMKSPVMVDLRNVFDPAKLAAYGFAYTGIGCGAAPGAERPQSQTIRLSA
ncbi:UDP-glucose dehydrogenase family protein [Aureimonas leprariae]|uniref:UDP-glucose 6-dehydrogenase n=1 Tax=Plantimonas leprariae TaxID=2615207 RepID=A0A7V7TX43_9HYPH|nr:UDP-glucose/GDP-mannose dehydrogenase family protein [Aureimonas leprariae]KAB0680354.1 UDP-glucose/GDP-mannose dehydrogenase family protein [Aureimonas leprariae]